MKHFILFCFLGFFHVCNGQQIDSIYINLYTDSLKKGTFNYINVDGLLSNGRYLPLDSTQLIFAASAGRFSGNSLWIDKNFQNEKVTVKVILRTNPSLYKQFDIYIKQLPDNEKLRTVEDIMNDKNNQTKSKKKGK